MACDEVFSMKLPSLFCDHMVLQHGRPLPVWGWAKPREKISVAIAGKSRQTITGKDGRWQVKLPALKPGGPFEMIIRGSRSIRIRDVLVGEVWICSGQSNMQMSVKQSLDWEKEIAGANRPKIRLFTAANIAVVERQQDVPGKWSVCSPQEIGDFSAVAYFFGRELFQKLKMPVGLVNTSWGGTIAEAWTSREALMGHPLFRARTLAYEKNLKHFQKDRADYEAKMKEGEEKCYPADPGNKGFRKGWADPSTPTADWKTMEMPGFWQAVGMKFSGVFWFRKEVEVPSSWAGKDLTLYLAACDKHDTTYFNNVEVGGIGRENPNAWSTPRVYRIPGRLVKAGRNVIAVRIYSYVYAGGMMGPASNLKLQLADVDDPSPISLAGPWRYRIEHNFGFIAPVASMLPPGPGNPNSPFALYRGMIEPLMPYGIRGAIWYQGESNADRAYEYRTLFPLMIRSWRKAWRQGNFPFLFVQLANYQKDPPEPSECTWAELQEAQLMALRVPNTGMAVTIDIGDPNDIHPINKQDVGRRLAYSALNPVYGIRTIAPSGPLYRSARREGSRIRLTFDCVGKGLVAKGGKLQSFALAGADRKFVWANAQIERNTIVVWSDKIARPVAVRYAWGNSPVVSLYNKDGLPASPFRTDQWPGITVPKKAVKRSR
jgi:sialate O-acetylesterase